MNKIIFPLKPQMQGSEVADLQAALQMLLDRSLILATDEGVRQELSSAVGTVKKSTDKKSFT